MHAEAAPGKASAFLRLRRRVLAALNLRDHQVDLVLAEHFNWLAATIREDTSERYGEQREVAVGPAVSLAAETLRADQESEVRNFTRELHRWQQRAEEAEAEVDSLHRRRAVLAG